MSDKDLLGALDKMISDDCRSADDSSILAEVRNRLKFLIVDNVCLRIQRKKTLEILSGIEMGLSERFR